MTQQPRLSLVGPYLASSRHLGTALSTLSPAGAETGVLYNHPTTLQCSWVELGEEKRSSESSAFNRRTLFTPNESLRPSIHPSSLVAFPSRRVSTAEASGKIRGPSCRRVIRVILIRLRKAKRLNDPRERDRGWRYTAALPRTTRRRSRRATPSGRRARRYRLVGQSRRQKAMASRKRRKKREGPAINVICRKSSQLWLRTRGRRGELATQMGTAVTLTRHAVAAAAGHW